MLGRIADRAIPRLQKFAALGGHDPIARRKIQRRNSVVLSFDYELVGSCLSRRFIGEVFAPAIPTSAAIDHEATHSRLAVIHDPRPCCSNDWKFGLLPHSRI